MPDVSVVVPTRNRPRLLADTLRSLRAQEFSGEWEIIVVDDASTPPLSIPRGVRVVRHDRASGVNVGRNTGAEAALSELVWYVDDDVELPQGWLQAVADGAARNREASAFGGPIRVRMENVPVHSCRYCKVGLREWESELDLDEPEGPIGGYAYGANMGAPKRTLQACPFDETIPPYYEEIEWQNVVRGHGGNVVYLPDAGLWHRRTPESMRLRGRLARSFRKGNGYAFYQRTHGLPIERRKIARILAHTVRYRCGHGLIDAAHEIGKAVGAIRYR